MLEGETLASTVTSSGQDRKKMSLCADVLLSGANFDPATQVLVWITTFSTTEYTWLSKRLDRGGYLAFDVSTDGGFTWVE